MMTKTQVPSKDKKRECKDLLLQLLAKRQAEAAINDTEQSGLAVEVSIVRIVAGSKTRCVCK